MPNREEIATIMVNGRRFDDWGTGALRWSAAMPASLRDAARSDAIPAQDAHAHPAQKARLLPVRAQASAPRIDLGGVGVAFVSSLPDVIEQKGVTYRYLGGPFPNNLMRQRGFK
jgi:hypothetical protein